MTESDWKDGAQAAVNAIRATGATNYILLPGNTSDINMYSQHLLNNVVGNGWTGAHSWLQTWYDKDASSPTSNADTMIQVTDSANKMIFEVHQYFGKSRDSLAVILDNLKFLPGSWLHF